MKKIILIVFLIIVASCSSRTENEYSLDAIKLLQANEKEKAEAIIKEGLIQFPFSPLLKRDLFNFYMDTNQWGQAEEYLQIAGAGFDGGYMIINKIANHYFDLKNWDKAYYYFQKSGDYSISDNSLNDACPNVSIENYRNAALAAVNMQDGHSKLKDSYNIINNIFKEGNCDQSENAKAYLAEVNDWYINYK